MGEVAFEKDGGDDGVLARFNLNFFDLLIPIVVGVGGGSFVIVFSQALRFLFSSIFPFNKVFNNQVNLTSSYFKILMEKESAHIKSSPEIHSAISRLTIPEDSTRGGCVAVTNLNGKFISNTYLESVTLIDKIDAELGYDGAKSFMEIGAGFGVNIHLLIENYPNIRKYLLVDISPTLYVSTQYLRSFYGESVIDAVSYEENGMNGFSDTNDLEIICLLPSQLRSFIGTIDFFYNAHSFVEMTKEIVAEYSREISRLQSGSKLKKIALCTYHASETQKTVSFKNLPGLIGAPMREVIGVWPRDGYNLNSFYFSQNEMVAGVDQTV
jgi:putative sugar O-methyltransferase